MLYGQLLYFTSILVKHPDNGRKSDRNLYVNNEDKNKPTKCTN